MYVFNIYIVFILGDLSCMESSDSFTGYPHGLNLESCSGEIVCGTLAYHGTTNFHTKMFAKI